MVTFIKVRNNKDIVYCVNPDAITHFFSIREDGVVCFKCYLGGEPLIIPKTEFEQKLLPHIRLAN